MSRKTIEPECRLGVPQPAVAAPLYWKTNMTKKLLIVSCSNDVHVNHVWPHLESRGLNPVLLTPETLLDAELTLRPADRAGVLRQHGTNIDLDEVGAVWYRKPEPVVVERFAAHLNADETDFFQAECQEILDGLYALLADRYWLVGPPAYKLAARKLLQLAVARDCGFTVPRTIVTNNPTEATAFCSSVNWDVAIKSLSWASAMTENGEHITQYGVYCRRLTKAEVQSAMDHVSHSPSLLQEYVPKRCDLRVVAVGREHVFPVEIDSQNGSFSADDCRFHISDLPHRLVNANGLLRPVHAYMDRMNLQFGCFDFAVAKESGDPVFLECNVNGQWLWLEKQSGAPISAAIADVFGRRMGQRIRFHPAPAGRQSMP